MLAQLGLVTLRSWRVAGAALLMGALAGSQSLAATILLDDTWADGSRLETSLPAESRTNVSDTASVSVAAGTLSQTMATSSRRIHTYFTPDGSPVTLGVGDKLLATIEFIPSVALTATTSRNFRIGLFNDPTTAQAASDGLGDGGPSNGWADAEGYAIFMSIIGQAADSQFQINKRTTTDGTQTSLMGAAGAYTTSNAGGAAVTSVLGTQYTINFEIHKVSATETDLTATISDAGGVLSTHTVTDDGTTFGAGAPYDNFDQLMFRFSNNQGTAERLDFKRFKLEYIPIPEPATLALLGLGGVALLGLGRRRR